MTTPGTTTAGVLDVPGATLSYRVRGYGPPLLLVHGGGGGIDSFGTAPDTLARHHTVITYDRRGYGGSTALGATGVADNARDTRHLLSALADGPAIVVASSAGAIVALELLTRHPDQVRLVLAHEPPVMSVLPDAARVRAMIDDVATTLDTGGVRAALVTFMAGNGFDHSAAWLATTPAIPAALEFMVRRELGFTRYEPDVVALRALARKLVFAVGSANSSGPAARSSVALAAMTSAGFAEFPGNHYGYAADPDGFARRVLEVLSSARAHRA